MAKRQTKRKVTVVFKGREPKDPVKYLSAIEEVFRPGEIEVSVEPGDEDQAARPDLVPDEELETKARDRAAEFLDEKDRERREMEEALGKLKTDEDVVSWAERVKAKRSRLGEWLFEKTEAGFRFVAKVVVEQLIKRGMGGSP